MLRRRLMMQSGGGGRLPEEYQEVEFLLATGTQYIKTNYVMYRDIDGFEITLQENIAEDYAKGYILAAENFNYVQVYAEIHSISIINGRSTNINYKVPFGTYIRVFTLGFFDDAANGYKIDIDGTTYASGNFTNNTLTSPFFLFASNVNGRTTRLNQSINVHNIKWYKNYSLVGDFIPCYRKADHEAGMYDIVNGVFYTNQGTGEFIVGADVK